MFDRITHDPQVLAGRATLRGLRVSVAHVVNLVANGMTPAEIVAEHPDPLPDLQPSRESAPGPDAPTARNRGFSSVPRESVDSMPLRWSAERL
jgi:hypothetical protein